MTEQRTEAKAAIRRAINQLSEREAVFSHQALLSCSMSHALGQVSPERMADTLGAVIQEGNLLPRALIESGARIPAWTIQRAIDLEKTIIQQFLHAKDSVNPMATREEVQKSLQSSQNKQTLNPEQRAAVELAATTTDRVMGIQGYAGTGKTTLLNAVKELAALQGFQVIGLAPSATAARHLGNETDILNYTEQRFIIDTHLQKKTNEKTLIIIDESSMISNKEMHELLNISEKTGARLLLVGDKLQLPSIGSGKPFALLQEAGLTLAVMKILQRQHNDVLRAVVSATIGGDISTAMQGLAPSTTELPNKEERMDTLVSRYVSMNPKDRENTLLLVPANEDRHTVNQLVHYHLQNQAEIAKQEEEKNVLVSLNLTRAESARANFYQEGYVVRFGQDNKKLNIGKETYFTVTGVNLKKQLLTIKTDKGKMLQWNPRQLETVLGSYVEVYQSQVRAVAVGEQIRWTRNDKQLGICNGDTCTVTQVGKNSITVILQNGRILTWKTNEFNRQHWEYNYARTVNDAQGKTSDRVLALLHSYSPLSNLKLFYTAISRARDEVQLIVDDVKELTDAITRQTGEKTRALLDNELKWHVGAVKKYDSWEKKLAMEKFRKTTFDEFRVGELSKQNKVKDNNLFTECNLKAPKKFSQSKNLEVEL